MFKYENKDVKIIIQRPNPTDAHLLDQRDTLVRKTLDRSMLFIRQSYACRNIQNRMLLMELAIHDLNESEILFELKQLLLGRDVHFLDEEEDDTPTFAYVENENEMKEEYRLEIPTMNDLTGVLLYDLKLLKEICSIYREIIKKVEDNKVKEIIESLYRIKKDDCIKIRIRLKELSYPLKDKDFGESYDSENTFDLTSGNYIDTPNPIYINKDNLDKK